MPESTNNNPPIANDSLTIDLTVLDDPEFRKGFTDGLEAYLTEVAEYERPITTHEVCQSIHHELDPRVRQNAQTLCTFYGWAQQSQIYTIGFLAGWVAAHTSTLPAPALATN